MVRFDVDYVKVVQWIVIISTQFNYTVVFCCSNGKPEPAKITFDPFTGKPSGTMISLPQYMKMKISSNCVNYSTVLKRNRRQNPIVPLYTLDDAVREPVVVTRNKVIVIEDGVREPVVVTRNKRAGLYGNRHGTCSFYIDLSNPMDIGAHGYFHVKRYFYTVIRLSNGEPSYTVTKQTFPKTKTKPVYSNQSVNLLELSTLTPRHKRQARLYEVELCLALDNTMVEMFSQTESTATDEVYRDISRYYNVIINGIDSRFRTIRGSGYVINVIMTGLYMAKDSFSTPWIHLKDDSIGQVDAEKTLKALGDWSNRHKEAWSKCDHVMAITANNLVHHEGGAKTLGVSYLQSMCTNRSFSIIEDHGNMAYVSQIAAHELAHSLGAKHDGIPNRVRFNDQTSVCFPGEGYIMAPKASSIPAESLDGNLRRWTFSPCSFLYFEFYIQHLDTQKRNCLIERHVDTEQAFADTDETVELLSDLDHYCETVVGEGAVLSRRTAQGNFSGLCRSVPCSGPYGAGLVPTLAMEGLKCGAQLSCQAGRCQPAVLEAYQTLDVNNACPFGDQPGYIRGHEFTCKELIGSPDQAYKCYSIEAECCSTCYTYRRFSSSLECHYGDKQAKCTEMNCSIDAPLCCETCAIHDGQLAECKKLQPPLNGHVTTNTGTSYKGSVATFTCNQGYSLHGNDTNMCTSAGSWSHSVPVCAFGCQQLAPASYVTFNLSRGDYSVGTEAKFSCLHGFVLRGESRIYCQNDSTWNDEAPHCTLEFSSAALIEIPENIRSYSFRHNLATGGARASYSFIGYSHRGFNVTHYGHVTAQNDVGFNHENINAYRLTFIATSTVDARLKAKQTLVIEVTDVNDAPFFSKPEYTFHMSPPVAKGQPLLTVMATDEDLSEQTLTYSSTASGLYSINNTTGQIATSRDIPRDYEGIAVFNVFATDNGQPMRTATAVVRICFGKYGCENSVDDGCQTCKLSTVFSFIFWIVLWFVLMHF